MNKILVLLTSFLLVSWQCPEEPLTIAELVNIALENNPTTKQAWWSANRAAAALGSARHDYYPSINFDAGIVHGHDFKFINGPDTNFTKFNAGLSLYWLLYDFGERRASVQMAINALIAANWHVDWKIQKVIIKVLEHAYGVLHAQETLCASRTSLEEGEKLLRAARELNRTGLSPASDVYTSLATVSQLRMDVAQHESQLEIQQGKLAAILGLPADTCLRLACLGPIGPAQTACTCALVELAYAQRADLMAKHARVLESYANLDKVQASYAPKIAATARSGLSHYYHDKSSSGNYQVGLELKIPVFDGCNSIYKNRMAYADSQIATEELVDLQLDIALEVLTYSSSLRAAQKMVDDVEAFLENSLKAYDCVLARYRAGREDITETSQALRQLSSARVKYSDVRTRWLMSIANLAYATGTLVPYMEMPCEK